MEKTAIKMRLADEPFYKIKSGEKTVEVRLYDDKRKDIRVGDELAFARNDGTEENVKAVVVALYRFKTFQELLSSPEMLVKAGFADMGADSAAKYMYGFYAKEQEQKYGVLAIEFILI